MATRYGNFIGGEWKDAASSRTFDNRNPADTTDLVGSFADSGPEDVERAVAAAREAFPHWKALPAPKRGEILYRAAEILVRRKEELSRDMTREMGKVLDETRGDVQEAIDMTYYMAGEGRRQFGQTTPSEMPDKFQMSVRQPVGVAGLITPWNFPMAIPSWKMMPALILGNTVVIKPATDTPLSVVNLVKVLEEAGLPKGVVNMVTGSGSRVGTPLMSHKDVGHRLVHGLDRRRPPGLRGLRPGLQALPPRDGRQEHHHGDGRRPHRPRGRGRALGRLRHHRPALHRREPRGRAREGLQGVRRALRGGRQGPEGRQRARAQDPGRAVRERLAARDGRELREDRQGRRRAPRSPGAAASRPGDLARGYFHEPTIFGDCSPKMRVAHEEIFGPVVSVIPVRSLEEAIEVGNSVDYGLSASIYTQDVNKAFTAMRDMYTGIFYVNAPTIGAETHLPFGGTKNTGNGHREACVQALEVFSEWKSIYIDFSGKLQRAQID